MPPNRALASWGLLALGGLLLAGCAGPHSTGALWSLQNQEREGLVFGLTDAQRAEAARAYELHLADESLTAERARVTAALDDDCPGQRRPLAISSGDTVRDTIRLRAQADAARRVAVAQVALADWWLRRAQASGDARFCRSARAALATQPAGSSGAADPRLASLGDATVTRDPTTIAGDQRQSSQTTPGDLSQPPSASAAAPLVALSLYATRSVDRVRAAAPLPQYLAAVYGGRLLLAGAAGPDLGGQSPEAVVDDLAPAHPEWEPDALYAALTSPS